MWKAHDDAVALYVCMADCGNNSLIVERVARNHVGVAIARHVGVATAC